MAALRTASFYIGVPPVVGGVNTWTVAYTVPAGHRIKLHSIVMANQGTSSHSGGVRVGTSFIIIQQVLAALGSSGSTLTYLPDLTLNAGETLQVVQVVAAQVGYALSGYIFFT